MSRIGLHDLLCVSIIVVYDSVYSDLTSEHGFERYFQLQIHMVSAASFSDNTTEKRKTRLVFCKHTGRISKTNPDIFKIWRCLASTMTKVPIVQSLDARQQEGDCKTQKVDKTEPFDVIERVRVGVFGDRGHDHCKDEI